MSPEQARGKPVDKRTDVWAFGVVLFEMLTNRRPFHGETVSDSVAAILKTDPDWSALPAETPFLIRRLLRHCLNRDPRERLADMRDARIEINEALTDTPPMTAARSKAPWVVAAALLAALTAGAAAVAGGWIVPAPTDTAEPIRFSFLPPANVRASFRPALSPDGRQVAFLATNEMGLLTLWVHSFSSGASQMIAGTERLVPAAGAFWSPDSRTLGFFADGKLKRVDLSGGVPVAITEAVDGRGGTWNQAGDILFSLLNGPLFRVPASGGTPVPVTTVSARVTSHRFPLFLGDGDHFVFLALEGGQARLLLGSLTTDGVRELRTVEGLSGTVPPDLVLFTAGGQLIAQRVDVARGVLAESTTILDISLTTLIGWASANRDVLVYRPNPNTGRVALAWVDRRGKVSRVPLDPSFYGDPALSPDGRQLVLAIRDGTSEHIWVYDVERGSLGKRTFESTNTFPIWSRDGRHLIFSSGPGQTGPLMRAAADGSGTAEEVTIQGKPAQKIATSLSADGTLLALQYGQDIVVRTADGNLHEAVATPAFEREGRFAPSGQWLAYRSNETGRDEVYVQSYPPGSGKWQISTQGGAQPMWNPNGTELFYKNGDRLMAVPVQLTPTFKPGVPEVLFQISLPERTIGDPSRFGVSADGQRFLVTTMETATVPDDVPVHVILNWRR
jgi:Tol biopolymer transport system component